ncbi:MAG: PDGLE domain-containing protein, partial [Anaerolineae bacterium]|nr:PDGLE domain-containing protein [Anaerolineae bacterium]
AIGAWLGVEIASIATSLELALSNTVSLEIALPAMAGMHALIGLGEALITVAALAFIQQTRPDLIRGSEASASRGSGWIAAGLLIALAVTLVSPLADPNPDGLERVAEDQGFIETAQEPPYAILPDYSVPFVESEAASTILAGIIGTLFVAGVGYATARLTRREGDTARSQTS